MSETHVCTCYSVQAGSTSSLPIPGGLISVPRLEGRVFGSGDQVLLHHSSDLLPQSVPAYSQSQGEAHLLPARMIDWSSQRGFCLQDRPRTVGSICTFAADPDCLSSFPAQVVFNLVNQCTWILGLIAIVFL